MLLVMQLFYNNIFRKEKLYFFSNQYERIYISIWCMLWR